MRAESTVSELQCLLRAFLHAAQAENTVRGVLLPLWGSPMASPVGQRAGDAGGLVHAHAQKHRRRADALAKGAIAPTDKGQPRGDTEKIVKENTFPRPGYNRRDGRKTAGAAANNARRSKARAAPFPPSPAGQCLVVNMRDFCALVRCPGMIDDAGGDSPHACPRRSVTAHSQPQRSHSPRQTTVPTALTGRSPSSSWPAGSRCPAAAARRRARPPAFAARARPPPARCVSPRAPCAARSGWRRR